jgi:hypothetical protein
MVCAFGNGSGKLLQNLRPQSLEQGNFQFRGRRAMANSYLFDSEARLASLRHNNKLDSLRAATGRHFPDLDENVTFLAHVGEDYTSATAIKSWAIAIFEDRLLTAVPEPISEAVAIHEIVHLRLGGEIRNNLCREHPDVLGLLHKAIIPCWLDGKVEIRSDQKYLSSKGWRDLYEGWWGPTKVRSEKAKEAINRYFDSLKQGRVVFLNGELLSLPPKSIAPRSKSVLAFEQLNGVFLQEMVTKIITGYELLEYLTECFVCTLAGEMSVDLFDIEEGFATYISSELTGIPLNEIQKWCPQDQSKIKVAQRIKTVCPSIERAIQSTVTYGGLITFSQEFGVVRRI